MIRSQLISKFNLLRANDLVLLNERCLQRSALCCAKPNKIRYRAPEEITDQRIEEAYFQKDDNLLNWNQVVGQANERKRNYNNQNQFAKKQSKPRDDRQKSSSFRKEPKKMRQDSTDPEIRQLFV